MRCGGLLPGYADLLTHTACLLAAVRVRAWVTEQCAKVGTVYSVIEAFVLEKHAIR